MQVTAVESLFLSSPEITLNKLKYVCRSILILDLDCGLSILLSSVIAIIYYLSENGKVKCGDGDIARRIPLDIFNMRIPIEIEQNILLYFCTIKQMLYTLYYYYCYTVKIS